MKHARINVEDGVICRVVETSLKGALSFSPRGTSAPISVCTGRRGQLREYFTRRRGKVRLGI